MSNAALTNYADVAQIVLYMFWAFFAGLIYYLHRENKREGYPLESDRSPHIKVQGFPAVPPPKTFRMADGSTVQAPRADDKRESVELRAKPIAGFPGAPLEPTGDPMVDGVGPAAYPLRADVPDHMPDGSVRIQPLRLATDYAVVERDPDPRGMTVIAADGEAAGKVSEVWVDRGELMARFLEVVTNGGRRVLLPTTMMRVDVRRRHILVASILARHFELVPTTRSPDAVTLLEEDRIMAFYASGHLYATPQRLGPWA